MNKLLFGKVLNIKWNGGNGMENFLNFFPVQSKALRAKGGL